MREGGGGRGEGSSIICTFSQAFLTIFDISIFSSTHPLPFTLSPSHPSSLSSLLPLIPPLLILTSSPHPPPSHPSSCQLSVWWFLTFTASDLKERVHYLNGVQYLYDTIRPDQIEIPEFVLEFDKEVGVAYRTF